MNSDSATASVQPSEAVETISVPSRFKTVLDTALKRLIEGPGAHHKWGPSTLKNREICPGWKNRQRADNGAADEGTLMHLAFEKRDLSFLPEQEQKDAVQKCIDYVTPLEAKALEIHREVRLEVLSGMTFGTADEVILRRLANSKLHADIIDEKYGRWDVDDAKSNRQGMSYTLAVFERWPEVQSVTVHFLSPRIDSVTKHTFFRSEVPKLAMIISTIINRAEAWDKTRDPSMLRMEELNCTYCARSGTPDCPLSVAYAVAHAKKYKPLEVAEETHSSQITEPDKMRQFYIALKVLEKMVDSGKQHVHAFAQTQDIPGFVRRERKGKVTITNSVSAWPVLKELLGIKSFDDPAFLQLIDSATFSYSDIAKKLTEGIKGKGSGEAKSKILGALWTKLQDAECVHESEPTVYLQRDKEDAQATIDVVATPVIDCKQAFEQAVEAKTLTEGAGNLMQAPANNRANIPASCVTGPAVD